MEAYRVASFRFLCAPTQKFKPVLTRGRPLAESLQRLTCLCSAPGNKEPGVRQLGIVAGDALDRTMNPFVDLQERFQALGTGGKHVDSFPGNNLRIEVSFRIVGARERRKHIPGDRVGGGRAARQAPQQYNHR